jgi:putative ABC transport system permease protein
VGPTLVLAIRNALRQRGRLVLATGLLAVGGATFMAGLNVAAASDARMAALESTRGYDIDIQLARSAPTDALLELVRGVPGVAYVEPLGFASVTPVRPGEAPVSGTHKDGGHGSLPMWAQSADTRYQNTLLAGRALRADDTDAVVVGRRTLSVLGVQIGDPIWLAIDGQPKRWQVVGVVQGFGVAANTGVFASQAGFAAAIGQAGLTSGLRIETTRHDAAAHSAAMAALLRALRAADLSITDEIQVDWLNTALRNHVAIVQGAFQFLGLLMGLVGAFTLASAISTSVAERSREFGVMQTLGATPARIVGVVISEGALVGALSWVGAVLLGAVLSYVLGVVVGVFLFDAILPLTIGPGALLAWLAIALGTSALAGAVPAAAAARLTVREALAYG